ncbi:MAG: hypothetical protein FJY85_24460, partial [Deltaproteobacteria bacterium]|nr:hypothetical protein [Deltaproteobacteria bacterium]
MAKNEYKMVCEIEGKSEKTIEHNMMVIGFVQKYVSGGELTEAAVRGFLAEVAGRRKMTTVNSYARAFRTFCHFLVNEGYVNADPMMNIKTPKIPRKFPSVLSEEDIK